MSQDGYLEFARFCFVEVLVLAVVTRSKNALGDKSKTRQHLLGTILEIPSATFKPFAEGGVLGSKRDVPALQSLERLGPLVELVLVLPYPLEFLGSLGFGQGMV